MTENQREPGDFEHVGDILKRIMQKHKCPKCGRENTTRLEWYENDAFRYFFCWDCDHSFTVKI